MWDLKGLLRPLWARLLVMVLVAAGVSFLARNTYSAIVWKNNVNQLEELNRRSLYRAESMVDYAIETLSDLQLTGLESCDAEALKQIQRISFLRGSIKDIQVLDANQGLLCAGAPLSRELGVANFEFYDAYAAKQYGIYFHDISRNNSGLLGIARHVDADTTFLAVLNLDSLLFDVFPAPVRNHARADLVLGHNVEVASQIPLGVAGDLPSDFIEFVNESNRYPLEVRFTVDAGILWTWNHEALALVGEVSLVAGLILGWMLLVWLGRPVPLRRQMSEALKNGEFVPFMQPIFDIEGRNIVGCEVLMRWVKPNGEIIPPYAFIPLAEETGLIVPMTRVLMRDALVKLKNHLKRDKNFKVAFNIVPADLISHGFEADLCKIVSDAGVARRHVVLEITERQEFSDQGKAILAIKSLRECGFRVALDDTGVGHNGLSNVHLLGADIIKIDKMFVDRVGVDSSATTIVQMLVRLANELGMRTVAEGIETEEQLEILAECNVNEGQGFLVSKPLPYEAFEILLGVQNVEPSAKVVQLAIA